MALGKSALTGAELQKALGLHGAGESDFFDTLVALKFLERDGDGPGGRYRNAGDTAVFLDKNSLLTWPGPGNGECAALPLLGRTDQRRCGTGKAQSKRKTAAPRCWGAVRSRNGSNS